MRLPLDTSQRAVPNATARLVNVQAEANPPDAKGPARVMGCPGVRSYLAGNGAGRGLHAMGSILYSVQGTGLYAGDVLVGTIPGLDPVRMADNGQTLVIAASNYGYALTGGALEPITDEDFPGATTFDFLDGYFPFIEPNSGRFWVTDLYSVAVDPLKFATAEGAPDNLVDLIVDHREVLLFGHTSLERWWNSGADNFPLERSPQGFTELGCLGGVSKLDNSVMWIASDGTARRLTGSTPQRISTHAIEEQIQAATGTPRAFTYSLEGHLVYVVNWDDRTLCYDATTGAWFERQSYHLKRWRGCASATIDGTVYVQDRDTGAIGILDPSLSTEWGDPVVAQWTYPAVSGGGRRLFHSRLELLAEMGSGAAVRLELSNDGGKTWIFAPDRTLGGIGEYRNRAIWTRLGSSRDRVYRMSVSHPGPINIQGTSLEVS